MSAGGEGRLGGRKGGAGGPGEGAGGGGQPGWTIGLEIVSDPECLRQVLLTCC